MQQDADFITADFLYMFRASCAHHLACTTGGSSLCHITDEIFESFVSNMTE